MKKLLAATALTALTIVFATPFANAQSYASNTLTPQSQVETGDTVTITDKYGDNRLLCFSDAGPCEDGNTVGMDSSPKDATDAMLLLCSYLQMNTDFENVTCAPTEGAMGLTAAEPGPAGAAIHTSASFAEGGGWEYPTLYYDSGSLDPVKSGRILTATVGTLSDILGTSVYPVLLIVAALIGLGYLVHFVYDQVGTPISKESAHASDVLAENRRIMQRIHDKWPGHDDHSSYV